MNWMLLRLLERKMVEVLLRSPMFHRGVQKVHKSIHELQHGKPPEYYGGTNLESPEAKKNAKKFIELFWEELKAGHKPEPRGKK